MQKYSYRTLINKKYIVIWLFLGYFCSILKSNKHIMALSKENLYKQIVSKMTANGEKLGLSERSINENLDVLIPLLDNDSITEEEFLNKTLDLFKTSNANIKNDVSVGIKNYKAEKEKLLEEEKKKNKPNENLTEMEKLLERIKVLEDNNTQMAEQKKINEKKSSIKNYLKEKGVDNEKWIDLIVDQVSIKGEDVVEDRGKQLLDMYNTMVADPKLNITPNQHQNTFNKDNQLDEILKEAGEQVKNSI